MARPGKTAVKPKTGMAGLYGGQGPQGYVEGLYKPAETQAASQQAQRLAALTNLLSSFNSAIQKPSTDYYGAAAGDAVSGAQAASQSLAAANPNDQTQAMLRAIGAPQSQQDQVTGLNNQAFNGAGAVGQYVGGALPAGVFAADAQARGDYLRSLPVQLANVGAQGVASLGATAAKENQALALQKIQDLQKARTDLANFVQDKQKAKVDAAKTAFDQNLATAKYNTGIDEFNSRQSMSMTKFQWQQSNADRAYGLSYARYVQAEKKAAQAAKSGGLTPNQKNLLAGKVQDYTKSIYQGVPGHVTYPNASNGLATPRIDSWKQKPMKYQQAIKTLINRYPSLGASGAIAAANELYQPGEGGRPPAPTDMSAPAVVGPTLGQAGKSGNPLVDYATRYIGVPYSWGGGTPKGPTRGIKQGANTIGYDCSSFIQAVMVHAGVKNFPRTTYAQAKIGQPVAVSQLQPGDAVFTRPGKLGPEHVGLYIGNGEVQESPHTGDVNKIIPLKDFLSGGFVVARRYLP